MADDPEKPGTAELSRRDLLKQAAAAGAVAVVPLRFFLPAELAVAQAPVPAELWTTLTAGEAEILEAMVARLIPTDANGPGAKEARAARYIDRALGGALAASRAAYADGLAALDRYTRSSRGAPFVQLSATDQDSVLIDVETGAARGFTPSAAAFFTMVRTHTIQGTFSDPFYGGNANFVGWDLIGYPGVRLAVSAEQQRLDAQVAPTHTSAYDHQMFAKTKRQAQRQVATPAETRHGD